jgi:hypothetical protein
MILLAVVVTAPLALAQTRSSNVVVSAALEVGAPGLVLMRFDGSPAAPSVTASPKLSCVGPTRVSGGWEVVCNPVLPVGTSTSLPCKNPVGLAGGTPVTIGTATVRVSCGNGIVGTCSATWIGQGSCDVELQGSFRFPLHCVGSATGTIVGEGVFYAECLLGS